MTYEFQYMMHLTGAAAAGIPAQPPTQSVCWERVIQLAKQQQLLALLDCAIRDNPAVGCPEAIQQTQLACVFPSVIKAHVRHSAIIRLLGEMENEGIRAYVAKGFAAAANYAVPDCRISSDTDMFVDPADEEKACQFLSKRGFSVSPRWENGHHSIAKHPSLGIVEVHIRLYDELVQENWFDGVDPIEEPLLRTETPDGAYYTPGITDHLLFIILHMVKHFIQSGMSLRMMLDIALYFRKHRENLDTQRIWSVVRSLKYDRLLNAIAWATIRYCGLEPGDFPGLGEFEESRTEMILSDLEEGGWLGFNHHDDRKAGWYEYNRQVMLKKKSPLQYRLYMLQWYHSFKLRTLFPKKKHLIPNYPWVEKYPFLIPFAWLHRLVFRGCALIKSKFWNRSVVVDQNSISEAGRQRVEMFRKLDMM